MKILLSFCAAAIVAAGAIPANAATRYKSLFQPRKDTAARQFKKAPGTDVSAAVLPGVARAKAPVKEQAANAPGLHGYLFYSDNASYPEGFYKLAADGAMSLVYADPVFEKFDLPADNGWYADGKVCSYYLDIEYDPGFGYYATGFYYSEIDFATGAVIKAKELDIDNGYMQISAYNSTESKIYGFGYDFMGNFGWVSAPADNPGEVDIERIISDSEMICYSLTFNPIDGKFYGVTTGQKFVSITTDGTFETIAELDPDLYDNMFQSGLAYIAKESKFYWNPQYADYSTGLATISPDGTVEPIETYEDAHQFTYLFTTETPVDPALPTAPELTSHSFADGALSGIMSYKLPSTLGSGAPIQSGELEWFATLDGAIYSREKAAPDAAVNVEYSDLTTGFHTFGMYVQAGEARSTTTSTTLFIGIDTPADPANVTLTTSEISWEAVTGGANGGYIDLSQLKYEAYLNGELVATTTETSVPVDIAASEYGVYQATVVAVCGDSSSDAGTSNKIVDGKPMDLPVLFKPTAAEFELMTQVDANGDKRGWSYSTYYGCLVTTFSKNGQPMDDWIFLPAVNLPSTDRYYTFGMTSRNMGIDFQEEYAEVAAFYGKPSPDAPSVKIIDKFKVGDEAENIGRFQIETPGTWYIGIHCVSEPDQYGIIVKNLYVRDEQIVAESPAAVTGLEAVAHDNGVLKATVAFAFPTETYLGNKLAADTEMTATVTAASSETVSGRPGEIVSTVVETVQGTNTISVSAFIGESGSPAATCEVYTGVDIPDRIKKMTLDVAPDMMSAELYWEAPTVGVNGGYIDPALISYEVYRYVEDWYGSGWEKLADCGTDMSYNFSMPAGAPMETVRLGVLAINVAGHSGSITYRENLLGTPYDLPIVETFEEPETLDYNPWLIYYSDNGVSYGWAALNLIAPDVFPSETKSALYGRSRLELTTGSIGLPRFSTVEQPGVILSITNYAGEYAAYTRISAQTHDLATPITIGEFEMSDEDFAETTIILPEELLGKEWVQIYLESEFADSQSMMLATNIEVHSFTDAIHDAASYSSITGGRGFIRITGHEGDEVTVTTPDGRNAASLRCGSADFTAALPAGLYIVRAGTATAKVLVK